jgi:hypothetical protein
MSPEAPSVCDEGQELLPFSISVVQGDSVDLEIRVCRSIARIRVWLDSVLQLDETEVEGLHYRTPALATGSHLLFWSVFPATADWKTKDEVSVRDIVRFRRKKSSDGDNPIQAGFISLLVQP